MERGDGSAREQKNKEGYFDVNGRDRLTLLRFQTRDDTDCPIFLKHTKKVYLPYWNYYILYKRKRLYLFSRALNPGSKKYTLESKDFFFEPFNGFSLDDIYHALDIIAENQVELQKWVFEHSKLNSKVRRQAKLPFRTDAVRQKKFICTSKEVNKPYRRNGSIPCHYWDWAFFASELEILSFFAHPP